MTINQKAVDAIRILSADGVQKANSGHPGLPLGAAPMAYQLWAHAMNHNPQNPNWLNRDRFVLSAGHGSMLIYSLLHLFGYGLSIDDLKSFRQWDSLTPGHPEFGHTIGIETTTGPLGAGMANAVGMAMAEAHLAATFNEEGFPVVDHYTYVLAGDGCMMEGLSSEAMSLAGTLGLGKLIVLYDSNRITIEGTTDIAFRENVQERFKAYGFRTIDVADGTDLFAIGNAIALAKADTSRPTLIEVHSQIGFGSPREGTASAHGEPLGLENIAKLREKLGWENTEPFFVDDEIYAHYKQCAYRGAVSETIWNQLFDGYRVAFPEKAKLWDRYFNPIDDSFIEEDAFWTFDAKPQATRNISGEIINRFKDKIPNLFGGSADLAPSTKTEMKGAGFFSKEDRAGKNIHFGVRENAMAGIANGIRLHGGLIPFVATFFVFADFLKPMIRLSSLMHLPVIYVLTHDSIGVGEDGPTHEPIEQLTMLRAQPNVTVLRPADANETAAAWAIALRATDSPTVLVLTRQNLPQLEGSKKNAFKGGYIVSPAKGMASGILMASGSEVNLAIEAQKKLREERIEVNVVSLPSFELFKKQPQEYQDQVLPNNLRKRVAIEAGADMSWNQFVGLDGKCIGLNHFGASAPGEVLFEKFGFTVQNVVDTFKSI
ncbi:MAG: transketolase [Erysipelotrichaceae bacterium]